jgi:hypothetical protein
MLGIFQPVIVFLLQHVVIKFGVFAALIAVMSMLMPLAVSAVAPWVSASSLTAAFAALPSGVWYWIDLFQLGTGLPIVLAAYVARFVIRRLPVIG